MDIFYLSIDKNSDSLFSQEKKNATFFELLDHKQAIYTFSLRSTSGYLKVSPNGSVIFDSPQALEWEKLCLKVVYPQL